MSMTTTALAGPTDAAIEDRVKAIPQFQGRVYTGNVPDGEDVPTDVNGYVLPYVVLMFGGLIQTQGRDRGIVGVRGNLKYHPFMALVVGATDLQSRNMADLLRNNLEGWEPLGNGEITEETSGNTKYPADNTLKPTRFMQMLTFSLLINP